jgi:hypothetical protein
MPKAKGPTTKERIRELETVVQNLHMAMQMSQGMLKHLTNQFQTFQRDLGDTMGMVNDFQYRTLAMLELGNFNKDDIDAKAADLKLADFTSASDKEDTQKGYTLDDGGVVAEDSVVIVTSTTEAGKEDFAIFRSKFPMSECLTPNLRDSLLGAKVGDVIDAEIYGINHKIEILGLRKVPAPAEEPAEAPAGE